MANLLPSKKPDKSLVHRPSGQHPLFRQRRSLVAAQKRWLQRLRGMDTKAAQEATQAISVRNEQVPQRHPAPSREVQGFDGIRITRNRPGLVTCNVPMDTQTIERLAKKRREEAIQNGKTEERKLIPSKITQGSDGMWIDRSRPGVITCIVPVGTQAIRNFQEKLHAQSIQNEAAKGKDQQEDINVWFYRQLRQDPGVLHEVRESITKSLQSKYAEFAKRLQGKLLKENALRIGEPMPDTLEDDSNAIQEEYTGEMSKDFESWLESQMSELIDESVVEQHVLKAYRKGRARAYVQSKGTKITPPQLVNGKLIRNAAVPENTEKEQFVKTGDQSLHSKKTIKNLVTEAAATLKNIAANMVGAIIKTITGGLLRKKPIQEIAAEVQEDVQKFKQYAISETTEYAAKTHAESQLDAYADLGHGYVTAIIETARDDRVCKKCAHLDGVELPIEQAKGLLPIHPRCRCIWTPVKSNPLVSKSEQEKRHKETTEQTIKRLQSNVEKAKKEEVKILAAAKAAGVDSELQIKAAQAQFNRCQAEVLVLERNAARLRKQIAEIRQEAEEFTKLQETYQKKLQSMKFDNAKRKVYAELTIQRESLVEYVQDILVQLPNVDRTLQAAAAAYEKKLDKLLQSNMVVESDDKVFLEWVAKLIAIQGYLKKLEPFRPDSDFSRTVAEWHEQVPKAKADAMRIIAVMKNPVKEFPCEPMTTSHIDGVLLKQYNAAASQDEKNARTAYGEFDKYFMMNSLLRNEDFDLLQEIYLRVVTKTTTLQDEKRLGKYIVIDRETKEILVDWKKILTWSANLQNSARHLTTDKPHVFTRHSGGFDFYGYPQIGSIINMDGFLSTCGTAKEIVTVDGKKDMKIDMEIRVPPGIPFIPLGKEAVVPDADEIVLPHGLRAKVLFIRELKNPYLIVEIVPTGGVLQIFKKHEDLHHL